MEATASPDTRERLPRFAKLAAALVGSVGSVVGTLATLEIVGGGHTEARPARPFESNLTRAAT